MNLDADSLAGLIWAANNRRPARFDLSAMACRADFLAVQARVALRAAPVAAWRLRWRLAYAAEIGAVLLGVMVLVGCVIMAEWD
jgi:hypothetical protein